MHITLDGCVTEHKALLYHEASLAGFLVLAAEHLGMQRVGNPYVVCYPVERNKVAGLSGVQFLAESSITAHTYPEIDFIYLDLFSCKFIDSSGVQRIRGYLGLKGHTCKVSETRGDISLLEVSHGSG